MGRMTPDAGVNQYDHFSRNDKMPVGGHHDLDTAF